MTERPDARELVAIARETFVRDLLPVLDDAQRYTGLMIANALAIALRELDSRADEHAQLRAIYPDETGTDAELERRLATDLRAGRLGEGERMDRVRAYLDTVTRARVAVANPKALR